MNKTELLHILSTYDQNKSFWRKARDVLGGRSRSAPMEALNHFIQSIEGENPSLTAVQLTELRALHQRYQGQLGAAPATNTAWSQLSVCLCRLIVVLRPLRFTPPELNLGQFSIPELHTLPPTHTHLTAWEFVVPALAPQDPYPSTTTSLDTSPSQSLSAMMEAFNREYAVREFEISARTQFRGFENILERFRGPPEPRASREPGVEFKKAHEYQTETVILLGKKALGLADYLPSNHTTANYGPLYYEVGKALINFFHGSRDLEELEAHEFPEGIGNLLALIIEQKINASIGRDEIPWSVEAKDTTQLIFSKCRDYNWLFYYELMAKVANEINPTSDPEEEHVRVRLELRINEAAVEGHRHTQEELVGILRDSTTAFNEADMASRASSVPRP